LEAKATVVRAWTTVAVCSEMFGYRHRHTATLTNVLFHTLKNLIINTLFY